MDEKKEPKPWAVLDPIDDLEPRNDNIYDAIDSLDIIGNVDALINIIVCLFGVILFFRILLKWIFNDNDGIQMRGCMVFACFLSLILFFVYILFNIIVILLYYFTMIPTEWLLYRTLILISETYFIFLSVLSSVLLWRLNNSFRNTPFKPKKYIINILRIFIILNYATNAMIVFVYTYDEELGIYTLITSLTIYFLVSWFTVIIFLRKLHKLVIQTKLNVMRSKDLVK